MKKSFFPLILLCLSIFYSCSEEEIVVAPQNIQEDIQEPLSAQEINRQIMEIYNQTNSFDWKDASDHLLWSAVVRGENILNIGYGQPTDNYRQNSRSAFLKDAKESVLKLITSQKEKSSKDILINEDDDLNYIDAKIVSLETIKALRAADNVRYLEPSGYRFFDVVEQANRSGSGCNFTSQTISSGDYGTLSSGAKIPWNFYDHKINQAWAYSKGRGVGVGIIDTGTSSSQSYLSYRFDDYYSGRYISKYGTYVDSWWPWSNSTDGPYDKCGHGTSAAGAIGGPNNNAGLPVGVAYECNLITYRGTSDVVLNGYHEQKGVEKALKALARRSDVKIISMSIGYPFNISRVRDAVKYAYNRGKLIFAAGGTSTNFTQFYGVIFPAWMPETVAITGVEEQNTYNECDICHEGSQIDFTIVMERGNNHHQPVLGYYNGSSDYFGGSSVATATSAGIAALVWSKYPYWNRNQVLARLKTSADLYPNKSNSFGYGNINALKAVRGY